MTHYTQTHAKPVGNALLCPIGSLNPQLHQLCQGYRKAVAGRYVGATVETLSELGAGPFQVSAKVDGQLWFLVAEDDEIFLAAPNGRVLCGDIPLLNEARETLGSRLKGPTVIAGELYVQSDTDRPRVGGTVALLAAGATADVKRLGFVAFDLVQDGALDGDGAQEAYGDRLSAMEAYLEGGKRARLITTEQASDVASVQAAFSSKVDGGKAEGLIVRTPPGRIYKVKPEFNLDAVIVGYTERTGEPDQVGSTLLAMMRQDGSFQLIGSCGNFGDAAQRKALFSQLSEHHVDSNYRYASSRGAMYRFVKPTIVLEVRVNDIQSENTSGAPITRMSLSFDGSWSALGNMPSVGLIHPVFVRFRDDKGVNETDIRMSQVGERCFVDRLADTAASIDRPTSEILKRQVYTKVSKGATAVKKLLMWKTNKEEVDAAFPAYVVHVTDYSPTRKDPIKRKVEIAPTLDAAHALFEAQLAAQIKRGWELVE